MSVMSQLSRVGVCLSLAALIPTTAVAQREVAGGPLSGPPVLDAPFSAVATTTVRGTLSDGSCIDQSGIARYHRDRAGRVRVEQTAVGPDQTIAAPGGQVRITVHTDPRRGTTFTLDPGTRTANLTPRDLAGLAIGGGDTFSLPQGGPRWRFLMFTRGYHRLSGLGATARERPLGTQLVDGIDVTGRRITIRVPAGVFGNERPYDIVEDRWESPELKMLIYSRSWDPHTVIEHRLTNVVRAEPSPDLFIVPRDYTIAGSGDNGWTTLEYAERRGMQVGRR
jgi:hypothetical protein